jgi:hypothetical protein
MTMNIFVLDTDPVLAAQMQCDKHLGKMLIEAAQMLSTAHWMNGSKAPYRPAMVNHPCSRWARASVANYKWIQQHGMALANEYEYRYGWNNRAVYVVVSLEEPPEGIALKELTPFAQAMPDEYKHDDPVVAYRRYYKAEKAHFAKWQRGREKPAWM